MVIDLAERQPVVTTHEPDPMGSAVQADQQDLLQQALSRGASAITAGVSRPRTDGSYEEDLEVLTRAAVDAVTGADHVGLTMRDGSDGLLSHAPTGGDVAELDRLQVSLGEGPCRDAILSRTTALIEVEDFATDPRWPRFGPAAIERGFASLLSFAMAPENETPGAIKFYSRVPRGFDVTDRIVAGAFAMQAAVAVYGAKRVAHLETALRSRDVIGQAKGVLIERYGIDEVQAFTRLVNASQATNLKLVDVAKWVVSERSTPRHAGA
ncbi:GAF and ANTAR domain-containing protein [Pseudonocardia alni]|uniref:GAF and ANTAR domain-containing protein n=1 Tax=Pseudonocardia alni TaxID=33907 RepID=UPI001AD65083|nr:GAF and ANTAR domain-containing protein [Pseudonocardia alni]MBO4240831.1 ANTAR domain-containing protein [Pseudonocardia alni]